MSCVWVVDIRLKISTEATRTAVHSLPCLNQGCDVAPHRTKTRLNDSGHHSGELLTWAACDEITKNYHLSRGWPHLLWVISLTDTEIGVFLKGYTRGREELVWPWCMRMGRSSICNGVKVYTCNIVKGILHISKAVQQPQNRRHRNLLRWQILTVSVGLSTDGICVSQWSSQRQVKRLPIIATVCCAQAPGQGRPV